MKTKRKKQRKQNARVLTKISATSTKATRRQILTVVYCVDVAAEEEWHEESAEEGKIDPSRPTVLPNSANCTSEVKATRAMDDQESMPRNGITVIAAMGSRTSVRTLAGSTEFIF
jgi:hypothetical protein